jgi:hypothetical protein
MKMIQVSEMVVKNLLEAIDEAQHFLFQHDPADYGWKERLDAHEKLKAAKHDFEEEAKEMGA